MSASLSSMARLRIASVAVLVVVAGLALAVDAKRVGAGPSRPLPDWEVPVTPADRTAAWANNSPVIAADPHDGSVLALAHRIDAPDFGCSLQLSGDGGRGWVTGQPVTALPPGAEKCYAPEIAFDGAGRLYFLFVGLAGQGNRPIGVYLSQSDDRGRTFSAPHQVLGAAKFGVRMALDRSVGGRGRIHLAWIDAGSDPPLGGFGPGPNPILAAHSDDGGVTFTSPVVVSRPERPRVLAPALALGPGGTVYVAYYDLGGDARDYQGLEGPVWDGTWSVVVSVSADRGVSFEREAVVDDGVVPSERVMLVFTMPPPAITPVGRSGLCAAWTDAREGDPDVLLRCSADQGRAWAATRRVNDDPMGSGRSQYQPRLASSPGGRVDVVFYDRRIDPLNRLNDVVATFSADGGATFAPNVRLTQERSNTRLGPQYGVKSAEGLVEFGGRLGLLSTNEGLLAAWTDTRNGDPGKPSQDIFAARLKVDAG